MEAEGRTSVAFPEAHVDPGWSVESTCLDLELDHPDEDKGRVHSPTSQGAWAHDEPWATCDVSQIHDGDLCDHAHHRMTIKLQQWLENSVLRGCSDFFRASRLIRKAFLTECHALMAQQEHTTHHSQG